MQICNFWGSMKDVESRYKNILTRSQCRPKSDFQCLLTKVVIITMLFFLNRGQQQPNKNITILFPYLYLDKYSLLILFVFIETLLISGFSIFLLGLIFAWMRDKLASGGADVTPQSTPRVTPSKIEACTFCWLSKLSRIIGRQLQRNDVKYVDV